MVSDRTARHHLWVARAPRDGTAVWEIRSPQSGQPLPATRRGADGRLTEARAVFPAEATVELRRALERYAQAMNLRDLQNTEWDDIRADASVRVEVVELHDGKEVVAPRPNGVWELTHGRQVRLRLYNSPKEELTARARDRYRFYFGILTIAPDGAVTYLAPHDDADGLLLPRTPGEKPLLVGDDLDPRRQLVAGSITPESEYEYLKVIVSRTSLQLKPLEQPSVLLASRRGARALSGDPLDQLLQRALGGTLRGETPRPVPPDWFTLTIPYRVVPERTAVR